MYQTIAIKIPNSIADQYQSLTELERGLFEDIVIRAFQKGHLSLRESAKLLNMSYEAFMEWLGERNLSFITASENELEESYEQFETFMETYEKP